jgi:hypothetical protein
MPESHLCRILLVLRLATKDSFFANDLLGRPISEPNNCLGARLMFQRLVLEGAHKCSGDWKTVETRVRDESANTSIISCRRSNSFRRHMATTEGRVHRGSSERPQGWYRLVPSIIKPHKLAGARRRESCVGRCFSRIPVILRLYLHRETCP